MVFRDEATAYTLRRTDERVSDPANWRRFIPLRGRERGFDISVPIDEDFKWRAVEDAKRKDQEPPQHDPPPRQCVWRGRRSDRPSETLYRLSGSRRRRDRWILVFEGRDDLLNRELSPEAAAYWIARFNQYELPPDLRHITTRTTDAAYPRLRPDWRLASKASAPSDDDRTAPGSAIRSTEGVRTDPDPTPTAGGAIEPAPKGTPEKETAAAVPVSGTEAPSPAPPPAPPPIDFAALADALLFQGKPNQAALVRFMADKKTATAEEIGAGVHGNSKASDKAIGKNARETTDSLAGLGSRLSFRFVSGTMFRKIHEE
jgi:hypothetical protein